MQVTSVIQRRDLEPLWCKAAEVAQHYEKAANCISAVIGANCATVKFSKQPKAVLICQLCKRYYHSAHKLGPHEVPCSAMHCAAIQEARKVGGSHIYTCPIGFYFWTSPFFAGERYAGALTSSGVAAVERQKILDRIFGVCKGEISHAEIAGYLDDMSEKSDEEIKPLAQMMQLCTEQISYRESYWEESADYGDRQSTPGYQQDLVEQERSLIASLRRGDNTEAQKTMQNLLKNLIIANDGNLERFKLKSMELVATLSRTGANIKNSEELVVTNNRYFKRIENSKGFEEITSNMFLILEQMAGKIFSFQGVRHASALRKAERFIWENYTRKISLKEIADVSGLSAPYFSTIFKDEMGENLSNYLNRLRIEKASSMLQKTEFPISGISTACGFEDQSWFSKVFKSYTGFSPCKYREQGGTINYGQSQE